MRPLILPSGMAAIQKIPVLGMTTEVFIYRSTVEPESGGGYDPSEDYGDDELTDPDSDAASYSRAFGWFVSKLQQDVTEADDEISTIDIHEIRFPVGTDVLPHDTLKRVDNGEKYEVIDTNADDTWQEQLRATLRRRE